MKSAICFLLLCSAASAADLKFAQATSEIAISAYAHAQVSSNTILLTTLDPVVKHYPTNLSGKAYFNPNVPSHNVYTSQTATAQNVNAVAVTSEGHVMGTAIPVGQLVTIASITAETIMHAKANASMQPVAGFCGAVETHAGCSGKRSYKIIDANAGNLNVATGEFRLVFTGTAHDSHETCSATFGDNSVDATWDGTEWTIVTKLRNANGAWIVPTGDHIATETITTQAVNKTYTAYTAVTGTSGVLDTSATIGDGDDPRQDSDWYGDHYLDVTACSTGTSGTNPTSRDETIKCNLVVICLRITKEF